MERAILGLLKHLKLRALPSTTNLGVGESLED